MKELDPYFGKFEGMGKGVACENSISIINAEATTLRASAEILWLLKDPSASIARFDLRLTAKKLRETADRLDAILDRQKPQLVAAE